MVRLLDYLGEADYTDFKERQRKREEEREAEERQRAQAKAGQQASWQKAWSQPSTPDSTDYFSAPYTPEAQAAQPNDWGYYSPPPDAPMPSYPQREPEPQPKPEMTPWQRAWQGVEQVGKTAQEWGPYVGMAGVAAPLAKPAFEWANENINPRLAEYYSGPELREETGLPEQIAKAAAGPALTAAARFGREVIEKGPGEALEASKQRWKDSPEPFPGVKGAYEMAVDPFNAIPIEKAPTMLVQGAKKVGPAVKAAREALPELATTARRLAADETGAVEIGSLLGKQGDEAATPTSKRYYHGTGSAFDTPDPGKFDPNGLYGPGYYMTDSPEVAGSYAKDRGLTGLSDTYDWREAVDKTKQEIASLEALMREHIQNAGARADSAYVERLQKDLSQRQHQLDRQEQMAARMNEVGPNTRAIDVPEGLRLLDMSAEIAPRKLIKAVDALPQQDMASGWLRTLKAKPKQPSPEEAWRSLGNDATEWNARLAELGYDGIRYQGGKRVPMADAAGQPIEHEAVVIFSESLPKIRNALSGTQGGMVGTGEALDIGSSATGAATGYLTADENATPEERLARAALGAAGGFGASRALRTGNLGLNVQDVSKKAISEAPALTGKYPVLLIEQIKAGDVVQFSGDKRVAGMSGTVTKANPKTLVLETTYMGKPMTLTVKRSDLRGAGAINRDGTIHVSGNTAEAERRLAQTAEESSATPEPPPTQTPSSVPVEPVQAIEPPPTQPKTLAKEVAKTGTEDGVEQGIQAQQQQAPSSSPAVMDQAATPNPPATERPSILLPRQPRPATRTPDAPTSRLEPTPADRQAVSDRQSEEARGLSIGRGAAAQIDGLLGPVSQPTLFDSPVQGNRLPLISPHRSPQSPPVPSGPGVQRPLPLDSGAEMPAGLSKQQQTAIDKVLRYRGLPDEQKLPLLQSLGLTEEQARNALKLPGPGQRGSIEAGVAIRVGASAAGAASQYDPNATWEENAKNMVYGGAVGFGLAHGGLSGKMGFAVRSTGNPSRDTLLKMYERGYQTPARTAKQKLDAATATFIRASTNRQVDLARYTARGEQAMGRPLTPAENLYFLKRENVDAAAGQLLDETMAPALQRVGDDLPYLEEFITYVHDLDIASAQNNPNRLFSGGRTAALTQANLTHLQTQLGPARMSRIVQSAQDINDLVQRERDLMVTSGVWDTQLAAHLAQLYPNYVPTRILDYALDPATRPVGGGLSMRDQGLRELTVEGTLRERESPVNAVIRMVYEMERRAKQNEAFNAFVNIRNADPQLQTEIVQSASAKPTREQVAIEGLVNGQRERYLAPRNLELVTGSASRVSIPLFSGLMHLQRALFTAVSPAFVVGNAIVDASTYAVRATMREAGARGTGSSLMAPVYLPKVMKELVKAYGDTFQGLTKGRFTGSGTARYLKGGGGMSGFFEGQLETAQRTKEQLARPRVYTVQNKGDLLRIAKNLATFKPVTGIGERVELAPRVAQMNLAEKRAANLQTAVMQGRDVTIDFAQGGQWTKTLNEFLLFFNVGVQAMVQPARAFREHPVAFASTVAGLLGGPLLASEAWNNSDPQRARDYADVPQNIKDRGIVAMLPGEAPLDASGNRHPQFLLLPMRDWAPMVILGREALSRAMGKEPREWQELAFEAGFSVSPIQGSSPEDVVSAFMPSVTSTALQLATNKDYFRNRRIATEWNDEGASEVSRIIADAMGVRPSQVEFAIRDVGGGPAGIALGATDLLAGEGGGKATGAQGIPGIGGLAGRFVKGNIGGQLDEAEQHLLQPWAEQALREDGVRIDIQPVGRTIQQVPLLMDEQTDYQLRVNRYLDGALANLMMLPRWEKATPEQRRELAQSAISAAREKAGAEVLKSIGTPEIRDRLLTEYGTTKPKRETLTNTEKGRLLAPAP